MKVLDINAFSAQINQGAVVIDTRSPAEFVIGFVPEAYYCHAAVPNPWLSSVQVDDGPVIILGSTAPAEIAPASIAGHIADFEAWRSSGSPIDMLIDIDPDEFAMDYQYDEFYLIDLREEAQYAASHLDHAEHIPLADLENALPDLLFENTYYLYGATYADAVAGAAMFKRYGLDKIRVINQGFEALTELNIPVIKPKKVTPSPDISKN
jgi:hydroxyacylglutathione hydrolase